MKPETKQALKAAFYEALFVLLGVLLALGANEWQQNRAAREHARAALASIVEELEANRANVKSSVDYHQSLLAVISEAGDSTPPLSAFSRGFISPSQLYGNAWEAAGDTDATSHMPFDTLLLLSKIYADQERYEEQQNVVSRILYSQLYAGGTRSVLENPRGLASLLHTFVYRENQLLESYARAFEALGVGMTDRVRSRAAAAPDQKTQDQ